MDRAALRAPVRGPLHIQEDQERTGIPYRQEEAVQEQAVMGIMLLDTTLPVLRWQAEVQVAWVGKVATELPVGLPAAALAVVSQAALAGRDR